MPAISNDELIEEINEMCEGMSDKPEYVSEVLGGRNLDECSQGMLYQKRKLAQIYLHEYHTVQKKEIQDQLTAIDKDLGSCLHPDTASKLVEELNSKRFTKNNGLLTTKRFRDATEAIDKYIRAGYIKGTYRLEFDLEVGEDKDIILKLYQRKIRLLRKSQQFDRLMQRHMKKKAPCLMGDSMYESQIREINAKIDKIKNKDWAL